MNDFVEGLKADFQFPKFYYKLVCVGYWAMEPL
jgi:hypothetical protein